MIDGLVERIGEQSPVAVSLSDEWEAPDIVLLHQIAGHWQDLREYFGSGLLGRLAGKQDRNSLRKIWGALSIVAARYPEIEKELEAAVEREPELLKEDPILFWFMSRPKWNQETAADALVASLTNAGSNVRGLTDIMIAELNHIGMDRNVLRNRLESIVEADPCKGDFGNRLLEALALAFPDHELVKTAWIKINEALKKNKGERRSLLLHPQTYIAVAYSEISSKEVLKQLQRHLTWMRRTDETMYDEALTRHLSSRLKRDGDAALIIADAILTPETPDEEAAVLASLLSASVPLSKEILDNLGRRLEAQIKAKLAPVVQDRVLSVSMSARNLLTKVIESGR